jgi:hypothetical protein
MRRISAGRVAPVSACAIVALVAVVACNRGGHAQQTAIDTTATAPLDTQLPARTPPALPKVPFSQQPCQSLSAADMAALKFSMPVRTVPYKETSDSLTYDNACRWYNGSTELTLIAYQTQQDYDGTSQSMKSTEHIAPSDIPGAFYDTQGYLWFAKDGYYVEIGQGHPREDVARRLVGRL